MATRATYQVEHQTFYCHWDGYPSGAAQRFANMVAALTVPSTREGIDAVGDRRGGLPFAFIRGNMDAEPVKGRDEIGGTEYHYEVYASKEDNRVWIMVFQPKDDGGWRMVNHKPLVDWINTERMAGATHYQTVMAERKQPVPSLAELLEGFPEVVEAWVEVYGDGKGRPVLATRENAEKIKEAEDKLAVKYGGGNPNGPIHGKRANAWAKALGLEEETPWARRNRAAEAFIEA